MNYPDGQRALVGDVVSLGESKGVVVISIDDGAYNDAYPEAEWSYLGLGVMIEFADLGLIHYAEPEDGLRLISRAEA